MIHKEHKRDGLQSDKFSKRKKQRHIFLAVSAFVLLIVVLFVFSWLSKLSFVNINTIEISGTDAVTSESIRNIASTSLSGRYIGLFSRANAFIYPESYIEDQVLKATPSIDSIDISKNSLKSILIKVAERIPYSMLCTGLPEFSEKDLPNCYLVDKDGFVFKRSEKNIDKIGKLFIQSTTTDMIGKKVIEGERYSTLTAFYRKIEQAGMNPYGILIGDTSDELYLRDLNKTDGDDADIVVVYFSERYSIDDTFSNLVSFWQYMKMDGKNHKFSEIKLQFPPNVYYTEIK